MGALHAGHGRLIDEARAASASVVVSIFVNPMQFNQGEDYARYPRPLEADLAFCAARGVDVVFAPPAEEMYPSRKLPSWKWDWWRTIWKAASGRAISAGWPPWC